MKPLVSIIIPAYNEEENIGRLLKSIKNQTYPNVEAIVVDDQSEDNTAEIAKRYTDKVFTRKHAERSVQRNFGAKKANGKYLVFLDADMELSPKVIEDCVKTAKDNNLKALVIPEKTVGEGFISKIRQFEREMYEGDLSVEVARFFDAKVFNEVGGYDEELTGPEDYDLPYRISKKHKIGRANEYLYHHEGSWTLKKLLNKRFYYAHEGAIYAQKHPELVKSQGNLLFRRAYFRNWKKFIKNPFLGASFIFVRTLEAAAAVVGYVRAVGVKEFLRTLANMFGRNTDIQMRTNDTNNTND